LFSFVCLVLAPIAATAYYLFFIAVDQYESRVGFAVRAEETKSALDVLGGLTGLSSASSSDTDILYEFIQSQEMVERVNEQLDLRAAFTLPEFDPVFALTEESSIEELVEYWPRMVRVYYEGSGLIEVRTFAFERETAHRLAELVFEESSRKINAMSAVARNDATLYAAEERDKAIARLIEARKAVTAFRIDNQIVDPEADIAGQMGLLNALQAQLAAALIERDKLPPSLSETDLRIEKVNRTIEVIETRIAAERQKLGLGGQGASDSGDPEQGYAAVVGEYEELQVDLTFAEQTYLSALSAYDAAVSEAQRTSRYLTAYLRPTMPETSTAPKRLTLSILVAGFLLVIWFILLLIYYSLRDRR
jgi:capsular polysaccharide transport system permease protein